MFLEVNKGENAIDNGSKLKFHDLILIVVSPSALALVDFAIKLINSIL